MTDIMINKDGDFIRATNGDFKTVSGLEMEIQGIQHEMMTYPGDLFYDEEYGFGLVDFLHRSGTELDRIELVQRIQEKLKRKESVNQDTINVEVLGWDMNTVELRTSFEISDKSVEITINIDSQGIIIEVI